MQIWEGQPGGEVGYVSAGGLLSLFCSRVLEELTRSSSPALYPLPASLRNVQRRRSSRDGRGWIFCPCMCLHECWFWSPQHIVYNPSASFEIYDYHIAVIHHVSFFFPSKWVSRTGFLFSFQTICGWRGDGGINQIKTPTENKNKKNWFEQIFFYWNVKLLTRFGTKVWSSCRRSFS